MVLYMVFKIDYHERDNNNIGVLTRFNNRLL